MFFGLFLVATLVFERPSFESSLPIKANGQKTLNFMQTFFDGFSLTKNYNFIMSTKLKESSIQPVHGIKAISGFRSFPFKVSDVKIVTCFSNVDLCCSYHLLRKCGG